jgi:sulfopyruvate decarboxylase subunit beta
MSEAAESIVGPPQRGMPLVAALEVVAGIRRSGQVVVTQMGSLREWPKLSGDDLDFHYMPSTMGGGPALALGMALAGPQREVLVFSGDGSLLMSLGVLTTIIAAGATNYSLVLLDNGVYEVTGSQKTPGRVAETDFAGLARAAGFPNVTHSWDLEDWRARAAGIFALPGPRFVWLEVEPVRENYHLKPACPMAEQVARFRSMLAT